jgi:hypothetical protein
MDANTTNGSIGINEMIKDVFENFAFYSSVVITFSILLLSISLSNPMKGAVYIGWVLIATFIRIMLLMMVGVGTASNEPRCNKGGLPGSLAQYDGGRNSIFILCFTFCYICFPMFISQNVNWYLVWILLVYIIFDCVMKLTSGCIKSSVPIIGEIFGGCLFGLFVSGVMYVLKLTNFLFVNDVASNREVCSMAKKQTFKCAVYKNGEIISSITR